MAVLAIIVKPPIEHRVLMARAGYPQIAVITLMLNNAKYH